MYFGLEKTVISGSRDTVSGPIIMSLLVRAYYVSQGRMRTTSGKRGVDAVKRSDMPVTMHGQQEPNVFYPDSASYLAEEKRPSATKRKKQGE